MPLFGAVLNAVADLAIDYANQALRPPTQTLPYGRHYVSGWTSSNSRYEAPRCATIQDTGYGTAKSVTYEAVSAPHLADNTYEAIKAKCLKNHELWEDPDFPPTKESLFYKNPPSAWPNIQWKRPKEICSNPELFVGGASRVDVVQGILGDCWFISAVASITTNQELMNKVIPEGQSFSEGYAGIFRFQFWQYGRWVQVLVDDRLPTTRNKLIYMHSEERNEFWSALLEKAYAKLNGSYEALSGGLISESLTDMTGGIVERLQLQSKAADDLLQRMQHAHSKGSLMGCSIDVRQGMRNEHQLTNGLMVGHAYSVTDLRQVHVSNSGRPTAPAGQVTLVRIRNPWGDSHEWNGAWSDNSLEWKSVSPEEKKKIGLTFESDGEFWMSFKDFVANFQRLDICYLGPDSYEKSAELKRLQNKWEGSLFEGSWKRRVNAGGCRNYPATFWTNPQYHINISGVDSGDKSGKGSIIVALMQKDRRKLRREGKSELSIGYSVYPATSNTGTLDQRYFQTHNAAARSTEFSNLREICDHHCLPPGAYVIVPSTFEPDEEGDFILRVYSERSADKVRELDDVTGQYGVKIDPKKVPKSPNEVPEDQLQAVFRKYAGPDNAVDAYTLKDILNQVFLKEFKFDGFTVEMTRSMVAVCDTTFTGKLNYDEFRRLRDDLETCKRTFKELDTNGEGFFSSYQFRTALNSLGVRVSNATFSAIVMRYSDRHGHVLFNDFVAAYLKLRLLFAQFHKKDPTDTGKARFKVEEFMLCSMYC